jgi:hypothetical protein
MMCRIMLPIFLEVNPGDASAPPAGDPHAVGALRRPVVESASHSMGGSMNKKPNREKVVPVQERDLTFAKGADDADRLKQHVDNPAQSPMKDGE